MSALSFSFVLVVFGCYKALNQVNHNPLYASCRLALSSFTVSLASQSCAGCTGLTCDSSMSDVWIACLLLSFWARLCTGRRVHRRGVSLSGLFELFLPFEMASQKPCMINVTTLADIVVPKAPAEYLKYRGFLFCFCLFHGCLFANLLPIQPFQLSL